MMNGINIKYKALSAVNSTLRLHYNVVLYNADSNITRGHAPKYFPV